ncbi:hypothetical protein L873DRAFT_925792 [Choiromyces venosus 120613-1]|uniref:Uncharacterized protein n=1 Tax=Choiromyces venosus 120613-1 TaxID=1336337 RepID=A0A3N4JQ66_9PEZI|nr:hypothetical protein L873DRAFT_925792 [Choiromyces venosus 120613-1]
MRIVSCVTRLPSPCTSLRCWCRMIGYEVRHHEAISNIIPWPILMLVIKTTAEVTYQGPDLSNHESPAKIILLYYYDDNITALSREPCGIALCAGCSSEDPYG